MNVLITSSDVNFKENSINHHLVSSLHVIWTHIITWLKLSETEHFCSGKKKKRNQQVSFSAKDTREYLLTAGVLGTGLPGLRGRYTLPRELIAFKLGKIE